jgi:hypothetical protein
LPIAVWDPFTTWLWRVPNHLNRPPEVLLNPALAAAGVALVDPQVLDAGIAIGDSGQQQGHASAVLNVSRVHFCPQHKDQAVHQDVPLTAIDAFGAIVAADAADASRSDRLTVDNARARLRVAANARADLVAQHVVELFPRAVQTP